MFERYNEGAKQALFHGRLTARDFGAEYIEPEHLLIAVLKADPNAAQRLAESGVTEDSIRARLKPARERIYPSKDMLLSAPSKHVLAYSAEEAELAGSRPLRPEHLLLGMVREPGSPAARLLLDAGLTAEKLRELFDVNRFAR